MTKVFVIYENVEPSNIEAVRVLKIGESRGLMVVRNATATKVGAADLMWADVLVFVRSTSRVELGLMRIAKKMHKFITLILDDDFCSLGANYGTDGTGYDPLRKKCLLEILPLVDILWAVNKLLADKYCKLGGILRCAITNTMVQKYELHFTRQTGVNREKIGLAAYVNDGSLYIFEQMLRPILPMLCDRYPNKLRLYLMSLKPDLKEYEDKMEVVYVPHLPYSEFKRYLGTEQIDIGLAPLDNEGFSQYKYYNKYIEYTNAGIPAIYSDVPLYNLIIKHGSNGIMCENTTKSWFDSICELIDNPQLRKYLINCAQTQIIKEFSEDNIVSGLVRDIPELVTYRSPIYATNFLYLQIDYCRFIYGIYRVRWWLRSVWIYLRSGNINEMLIKIKSKLKR